MAHKHKGLYKSCIKRFLDIAVSLLVLILFWWVYVVIALMVLVKLGRPVIFTQERPGKDGKIFRIMKFRSMTDKRDSNGNLLPDKERLCKFGRGLRSTSLDELPEIVNILKGDMSLIGPRPLLISYLDKYNSYESRRHEVRPGMTGLAQVSGRNALSWRQRFEKDIEYVDNLNFFMDAKIFFLTLKKILVREGIEYKKSETINDYFNGEDRLYG